MPEFTGIVTEPGLYPGIDEDAYHRDPVMGGSLSVSGAKLLLPPNCPAIFDYHRRHPKRSSRAMDLGTTVHGLVLGTGADIAVLDFDDRRTKAYKAAEEAALGLGLVPMLRKDYTEAEAIAQAVKDDDVAGGLFAEGDAETSMFWKDAEFGIWLRGRTDWSTSFGEYPTIVDFKTTADASPEHFAKSCADFGYHRQDPHYREGLAACISCDWEDIDFVFVVVPTVPPYLVMTYRIGPRDVEVGREQNRIAREHYRDCTRSGVWPKWSGDITDLELPYYARRRMEKEINDNYL